MTSSPAQLLSAAGFDVEVMEPGAPAGTPDWTEPLASYLGEACAGTTIPLTVLVNDPHRGTPTREVLGVLRTLEPTLPLLVIVATGSHRVRPAEQAAHQRDLFGGDDSGVEWVWHDARSDAVRDVGGFPMHKRVAEAPTILAVGSVEPHYFAGMTGAHKTATIGVMGLEGIRQNHAHALDARAKGCVLETNPVHDGIVLALHALEQAPIRGASARIRAVNLVVAAGRVLGAAFGTPLQALRQAMPLALSVFARPVREPFDVVWARVRAPLDRSFYQAHKGIENTHAGVRTGGVLVLDAACRPDGVGPDRFLTVLREAPSRADVLDRIRREGYQLGDHKAARLRALMDRDGRELRVALLAPGLDAGVLDGVGCHWFAHGQGASRWCREQAGRGRALVVEDAGNLFITGKAG